MNWKSLTLKAGFLLAGVLVVAATGCGTVQHNLMLQNDYVPKAGSKIEVGLVSNETGTIFDIPIETMFKDALVSALQEQGMSGPGAPLDLVTNCRIVSYQKGDAFKRWLMPGVGSTELDVRCVLLDSGKSVGDIAAKRTVDGGGAYTIGAWEKIFAHVASDVAEDIREKFAVRKIQ